MLESIVPSERVKEYSVCMNTTTQAPLHPAPKPEDRDPIFISAYCVKVDVDPATIKFYQTVWFMAPICLFLPMIGFFVLAFKKSIYTRYEGRVYIFSLFSRIFFFFAGSAITYMLITGAGPKG